MRDYPDSADYAGTSKLESNHYDWRIGEADSDEAEPRGRKPSSIDAREAVNAKSLSKTRAITRTAMRPIFRARLPRADRQRADFTRALREQTGRDEKRRINARASSSIFVRRLTRAARDLRQTPRGETHARPIPRGISRNVESESSDIAHRTAPRIDLRYFVPRPLSSSLPFPLLPRSACRLRRERRDIFAKLFATLQGFLSRVANITAKGRGCTTTASRPRELLASRRWDDSERANFSSTMEGDAMTRSRVFLFRMRAYTFTRPTIER